MPCPLADWLMRDLGHCCGFPRDSRLHQSTVKSMNPSGSHQSTKPLCQLIYLTLNQPSVIHTGGFWVRWLTDSPGGHQELSDLPLCSPRYPQALEETHPLCSSTARVPLLPEDGRQPSQHSERIPAPRINSRSHLEKSMTAANPPSES